MPTTLATLFDHLPGPPPPRAKARQRQPPRTGHVRYSRWPGKGAREQLRVWLSSYGSVNCGLYDSELLPIVRRRLLTECSKYPSTPLGVWRALLVVLAELRDKGVATPDILPRFVERIGDGFIGRVHKGGRFFETSVFDSPETAHLAMESLLAQEFPRKVKPEYVTLADFFPASPVRPPRGKRRPKRPTAK